MAWQKLYYFFLFVLFWFSKSIPSNTCFFCLFLVNLMPLFISLILFIYLAFFFLSRTLYLSLFLFWTLSVSYFLHAFFSISLVDPLSSLFIQFLMFRSFNLIHSVSSQGDHILFIYIYIYSLFSFLAWFLSLPLTYIWLSL